MYKGIGDGTFTDISSASGAADTGDGVGVAIADLDGDSVLDIYVVNANNQANKVHSRSSQASTRNECFRGLLRHSHDSR